MSGVYIVYPEKRYVPCRTIETWYYDAKANGKLSKEFAHANSMRTMAAALDDAGIITLGRPPE